jgi:hypothetical protein
MRSSHRFTKSGYESPCIKDFHWGNAEGPVKLGIRTAQAAVGPGENLEIRAAVQNVSNQRIELWHDFGLAVKHGEDVNENFSGPRSSAPIFLEPGEFKEILGWSLSREIGLKDGINECWVIYRTAGEELQSAVVKIEVRPFAE